MSNDSDNHDAKRQKTNNSEEHAKAPPSSFFAAIVGVPRILQFTNAKTLLVLRRTCKSFKTAADEEVKSRTKEILANFPVVVDHLKRHRGLHYVVRVRSGWTKQFDNPENLATSAIAFAAPVFQHLKMSSFVSSSEVNGLRERFRERLLQQESIEVDWDGPNAEERETMDYSIVMKWGNEEKLCRGVGSWKSLCNKYLYRCPYPGPESIEPERFEKLFANQLKILLMPSNSWKIRRHMLSFKHCDLQLFAEHEGDGELCVIQFEETVVSSSEANAPLRFQLERFYMEHCCYSRMPEPIQAFDLAGTDM